MAEAVTMVSGRIPAGRADEVTARYREALKEGPPPDLEETFLLRGDAGDMAILSVWHRRADLDAMLASGEEPVADIRLSSVWRWRRPQGPASVLGSRTTTAVPDGRRVA